MIKGRFSFEHCLGLRRSVLQFVVFYEFMQEEEGQEDRQRASSHIPEVVATVRPDVQQE